MKEDKEKKRHSITGINVTINGPWPAPIEERATVIGCPACECRGYVVVEDSCRDGNMRVSMALKAACPRCGGAGRVLLP